MSTQYEVDIIVKGIEISWTTWGKMRGERLVSGDVSYLKSENDKGFERIYSINIQDNQDFRIQQMISLIRAGILPDSMLITPKTKPENLAKILLGKGFSIDDSDPCMMMYLDRYNKGSFDIPGFAIVRVEEKKRLADWLNIINAALFGSELVTLEQFGDILVLDNTRFYLGSLDGKPVTACMTVTDGDSSVLEMVATLKERRRKGLASAVIDRALSDLRGMGIKTISLRAEADGVGVYKRLGFQESFKRVVASCDWQAIHKKACPCRIEAEKVSMAKKIFDETANVQDFVAEMDKQGVIGRKIWYDLEDNAIYITKMYACDCGGGCRSNNTLIGQRCHCEYVNHLADRISISYCKCAASFYEPMFKPLFGDNIVIEPVQAVLSGGDECIFRIKV